MQSVLIVRCQNVNNMILKGKCNHRIKKISFGLLEGYLTIT